MGHEDDSNHRTYLFVGNFVPARTAGDIGASRPGQCRFCSHQGRAFPTAFRRIHDDRTPQVDEAASAGRADFLRLANNDFFPNENWTRLQRETFAPRIQAGQAISQKNHTVLTNALNQLKAHPPNRRPSRQRGCHLNRYRLRCRKTVGIRLELRSRPVQKRAPAGEDQRALLTGEGLRSGQSPAGRNESRPIQLGQKMV